MLQSGSPSTLLVVSLLFLSPASARAEEPNAAAAARLLMNVIDTVVEHHIEAPTRQQMVLQSIRYFASRAEKRPPPGLSQRISAADPESLESLLARELSPYIDEADSQDDVRARTIDIAEFLASGGLQIRTREEHRVQEQVAGNRYVGIGVTAGMHRPTQQLKFMSVVSGGPADEAGVRKGDILETVDGQPTQGESLAQTIKWLRGEEGTDVTITVRQPNEKKAREYTITRGIVPFKNVKQPGYSSNERVAVIGFEKFKGVTGSTVHELRKIEAELPETVEVVTLDFRGLSGTNLHHGILLANALLDNQPIGQVETTAGVRTITSEPGALFKDYKLIILIDQSTQGTLLWIASAVKDSGEGGTVYGNSFSEGFVEEGIPVAGTDYVVVMPTARLRRIDGTTLGPAKPVPRYVIPSFQPLPRAIPLSPKGQTPISSNQPDDDRRIFQFPFEELADEVARRFLKPSRPDELKE